MPLHISVASSFPSVDPAPEATRLVQPGAAHRFLSGDWVEVPLWEITHRHQVWRVRLIWEDWLTSTIWLAVSFVALRPAKNTLFSCDTLPLFCPAKLAPSQRQ